MGRNQQLFIAILLLGAIIASSILILRRVNEEKGFRIEVIKAQVPNQKPSIATKTIKASPIKTSKRLPININKADKNGLMKLPGIGPKLADRILKYRKKNGPFYKKEDIIKVSGIGVRKFEKCKDMITID